MTIMQNLKLINHISVEQQAYLSSCCLLISLFTRITPVYARPIDYPRPLYIPDQWILFISLDKSPIAPTLS